MQPKQGRSKIASFIEALNSPGGAILVLYSLIILFAVMSHYNIDKAVDQIPLILGALIGIITGKFISKKSDNDGTEKEQIDNGNRNNIDRISDEDK